MSCGGKNQTSPLGPGVGHKGAGDRQLLKQLVHRVRNKIEVDPAVPQLLQTVSGAGYKLAVE